MRIFFMYQIQFIGNTISSDALEKLYSQFFRNLFLLFSTTHHIDNYYFCFYIE